MAGVERSEPPVRTELGAHFVRPQPPLAGFEIASSLSLGEITHFLRYFATKYDLPAPIRKTGALQLSGACVGRRFGSRLLFLTAAGEDVRQNGAARITD